MWVFIFTILAVSADAYVAGLSLGRLGRRPLLKVLYASVFTLILSAAFVAAFAFIGGDAADVLKIVSACILIVIGLKNISGGIAENSLLHMPRDWNMSSLTLVGISVAIDAAVASATVAMPDGQLWLVPVFMFLGHFLFLLAGSRTAKLLSLMDVMSRFSGGFLVVLGVLKLL